MHLLSEPGSWGPKAHKEELPGLRWVVSSSESQWRDGKEMNTARNQLLETIVPNRSRWGPGPGFTINPEALKYTDE